MTPSARTRIGSSLAAWLLLLSMPALPNDRLNTHIELPAAITMKLQPLPEQRTIMYPENREEFEYLIEVAHHGNAQLNYILGLIYSDPRLPEPEIDYKASLRYFENAIKSYPRHGPALLKLAHQYRDGLGTPKDIKKALALYERAGEAGSAKAYSNLSVMHTVGKLVPRDFKKAKLYAEHAAHLGHAESFEVLKHWDYFVEISSTTDSKKISEIIEKYKKLEAQKHHHP